MGLPIAHTVGVSGQPVDAVDPALLACTDPTELLHVSVPQVRRHPFAS